jgi:uncharacterized membrane protein YfcA
VRSGWLVTTADALVLIGAGALAGVISTVAGLASLVSYPVLLALGLSPLSANVTNTVALTFTGAGAAAGSRPELAGQGGRVLRLGAVTMLGGAAGAAVLLLTPPGAFEYVAPALIGGSSLALLLQPVIRRPAALTDSAPAGSEQPAAGLARGQGSWPLRVAMFGVAAYIGYFGAAGGILMLAVLAAMLTDSLARINALKNVISGLANAAAAVGFAVFGPVQWAYVVPLAAGFLIGGWTGPAIVRRLPGPVLRTIVGVAGLAVAVKLGIAAYR